MTATRCAAMGLSAACLCALAPAAMAERPPAPKGTRVDLAIGELFVPEGYRATDDGVHLVLHLHGAAWAAERNLVESGLDAVLVTVVLPGLSSVYKDLFSKPDTFETIMSSTEAKLRELGVSKEPRIAELTVTSFSAGFGGVREMLKSETAYEAIDTLVMADSIHTGFVGDRAQRQVDPVAMAGFLRFARDAVEGRKTLVVSHSEIKPETYASTTETADYLLSQIGGEREAVDQQWAPGLRCTSRFMRGGFRLFGFTGMTGPEHMKHLHHLSALMKQAVEARRAVASGQQSR